MSYVVRMPQMGMTMEEGVVVEWRTETDEEISEGDVVCVVESEKTTNEVHAREDGTLLERFVDIGETVEPGEPIAYVGEPDEDVPESIREPREAAEAETESNAEAAAGGHTEESAETPSDRAEYGSSTSKVSPRARRYAAEQGIPEARLTEIKGTGPEGSVVENDVIRAAESGDIGPTQTSARAIYEEREGSQLRQTIAERMSTSAREAPQVTLNRRIDVEPTLDIKERLAVDLERNVSLVDFVVTAVCEALESHPEFNSIYEEGVHKLAGNRNIGIAVDIEGGLVSPVIKEAGVMDLEGIARERERLIELAQSREYTEEDLAEGTFTITNLGAFDVEFFDPIINPPQVAILGIGALRNGKLPLSLTFDHRAVDGADAARFLDAIAEELAHPLGLVERGDEGTASSVGSEHESTTTAGRVATARSTEGMNATIQSRRFEWRVDEPPERGGENTGPTPVEGFLGSLASCLALSIRNVADRRDVSIAAINVTADGKPEEGRLEAIDITVSVDSTGDRGAIESVVETAERVCFVNNVIDETIERSISIEIP